MANPWIDLSPYGMTLMVSLIDPPLPPLPARLLTIVGEGDANGAALGGLGFVKDPSSSRWVHLGPPPSISVMKEAFPESRVIPDANMRLYVRRVGTTVPAPVSTPVPVVPAVSVPPLDASPDLGGPDGLGTDDVAALSGTAVADTTAGPGWGSR